MADVSGYKTQSADTSREIEEILFAAYRRMSSSEKLARIGALGQLVETVALAGLREQYPDADERELRLRLAGRQVPRELMISAFGWDPEVEGY